MRRVSKYWTLAPWFVPFWGSIPWLRENVERAVYDGLTQHEWFQAQVDEFHAAQRERHVQPSSDSRTKGNE